MELRIKHIPTHKLSAPSKEDLMNLIMEIPEYSSTDYVVAYDIAKFRAKKERIGGKYRIVRQKHYEASVFLFKTNFLDEYNLEIHQFNNFFRFVENNGTRKYPANYPKGLVSCIVNNKIKMTKTSKMNDNWVSEDI